jgi:phosphoribosylamine-glycine ligase
MAARIHEPFRLPRLCNLRGVAHGNVGLHFSQDVAAGCVLGNCDPFGIRDRCRAYCAPFPYGYGYEELSKGSPIVFREDMTMAERDALHFAEVAMRESQLVTSGMIGYVCVATGVGDSVRESSDRAYALARKLVVPNLRYRTDIGKRVINHDLGRLATLGYWRGV